MSLILPSLLAANPLHLNDEIESITQLKLTHLHIDMMDFHFTDNFGFSPSLCQAILEQHPHINLDVHLMTQPTSLRLIYTLANMGITDITIHPHTLSEQDLNHLINDQDLHLRIAILPTEEFTSQYLKYPRLLFLAVNPGFSHQAMQAHVLGHLQKAKEAGIHTMLDGGVNTNNITEIMQYKPDAIVIGGGLFKSSDKEKKKLLKLIADLQD